MKRGWSVVVGLVGLVAMAALAWYLVRAFLGWFDDLDKDRAVAVVGAAAILTTPIVTYFTTRTLERRRAVYVATQQQKVKLYEEFIAFWMQMLHSDVSQRPDDTRVIAVMAELTPRILAYGSNSVIKKWGALRTRSARMPPPDAGEVFDLWEELIKAMRADLGHSSYGLQRGDLARLFVNDIDDVLSGRRPA